VLNVRRDQLAWLVLLTQGIGAVFFTVFWASYAFALPSNNVLHGEPVYKIPISIFGGLFLLLTIILLVFYLIWYRRKNVPV
jgi:hypothetical protein